MKADGKGRGGLAAAVFQGLLWTAGMTPVAGWTQPRDVDQLAANVVERMLETDLDAQDLSDAELQELLEEIKQRLRNPADPNTADRGRLSGVPFLTPSHIEAILEHRRTSGRRIASWEELTAIEGFEPDEAEWVRWFFDFPPPQSVEPADRERAREPPRGVQVRWSGATGKTVQRIEGERRRPEEGGHIGDPWRMDHRIEIESRDWEASWMGWKHAGEPMAELRSGRRNSFHAHIRHPRRDLEIQAGDIRVGPGSGMVLGSGASSGNSFARLGSAGGHRRALGADPGTRLRGVAVRAGRTDRIRMDLHLSRQLRPATGSGTDLLNRPRSGGRFSTLAELESARTVRENRVGLRLQTQRAYWGGGVSVAGTAFERTVKISDDLFGRPVVLPAGRWQADIGVDGVWRWRPQTQRGALAGGWFGADAGWTAWHPLRTSPPESPDAQASPTQAPVKGSLRGAISAGGGLGLTDGGTLSASWHVRSAGFHLLQGSAPSRFHPEGRERAVTFRFSNPIGKRGAGGFRLQTALHSAPDPTPRARRPLGLWEAEATAWKTFQDRARAEISLSHRTRDGVSNRADWLGRPVEMLEQTRRLSISSGLGTVPAPGDGAVRFRTRLGAIRWSARPGDPSKGRPPAELKTAQVEDPAPRWGVALTQELEWRISEWLGFESRWSWHAGRGAETAHRIGRISMPSSVSSVYLGGDGSFRSMLIRLEPPLRTGRLVIWLRYDAHHLTGAFTNGSGLDQAQGPLRQTLRIQIQGSTFGK